MKELKKTLTVDPGLITGWAYWNEDLQPLATGVIKPDAEDASEDYQGKVHQMANKLSSILLVHRIKNVFLEFPNFWGGSLRSLAAAGSGSLPKLCFTVGCYSMIAYRYGCNVYFLSPEKWKGQMDKKVTARRIDRAIGRRYRDHNEADAVGMGLSLMEVL